MEFPFKELEMELCDLNDYVITSTTQALDHDESHNVNNNEIIRTIPFTRTQPNRLAAINQRTYEYRQVVCHIHNQMIVIRQQVENLKLQIRIQIQMINESLQRLQAICKD